MSLSHKSNSQQKHLNELFIILVLSRQASNRLNSSWTISWGTGRAGSVVSWRSSHGFMEERTQGRGQRAQPRARRKGPERESGKKTDRMKREIEKSMLYTCISLVSMRFWIKKKIKVLGIWPRFQIYFFGSKCCICCDAVKEEEITSSFPSLVSSWALQGAQTPRTGSSWPNCRHLTCW